TRISYLNKENDRRTSIATTTKKSPFATRIATPSTTRPIFDRTTTTAPTNSPYVTRNNTALTYSPPFDTFINRTVAVSTKSPPVTRRASYIPTTKLPVITYSTNSPLPSSRIKIDNISLSPKKRKKVVYDDDRSPRNVRPKKFESFVNQIWEQNQEMIMKTQKLEKKIQQNRISPKQLSECHHKRYFIVAKLK
ncbi:4100_t:CDS:2, partial [Entrophospora sp. SA101]